MKNIKYLASLNMIVLGLAVAGCVSPNETGTESYKSYGEQVDDKKIVNKIRANFRTNQAIPDHLINVSIDRNIVQLSGFVRTHQEADFALLSARNTPGVKDIIDSLIVLSDSGYAERRGKAEAYSTKR